MSVNAAIARAWDAMLAAHHEWHNALSRLADCDPAIKMTREKWLLPLVYELGWGHLEAITGGLCFPLGSTGDRSALRHLPRGLLAGQARPDRLDAPAPGWRERPLGHQDPSVGRPRATVDAQVGEFADSGG